MRPRGEGDDPVAGPVGAPSGSCELAAGEPPGAFPQVPSSLVEHLDVVAAVGE